MALKTTFHDCLSPEILTEMSCRNNELTLKSFTELAICLDQLLHSQYPYQGGVGLLGTSTVAKPKQLGCA